MARQQYSYDVLQKQVNEAVERVKLVLSAEKQPCLAADVDHRYEDKYSLAEGVTNAAIASQANCLVLLGLSKEQLMTLRAWAKIQHVSLRFKSEETCQFVREVTRVEESPTSHTKTTSVAGMMKSVITSAVSTKITEYLWEYTVDYKLEAIRGVGEAEDARILIQSRKGTVQLKTPAKDSPYPSVRVPGEVHTVGISWLLNNLEATSLVPSFGINRSQADVKTPRRNGAISQADSHFNAVSHWTRKVEQYLLAYCANAYRYSEDKDRRSMMQDGNAFIPVLPLFERSRRAPADSAAAAADPVSTEGSLVSRLPAHATEGPMMAAEDRNWLLAEEHRSILERAAEVEKAFPSTAGVFTFIEVRLRDLLLHIGKVAEAWTRSVDYIEEMLRKQLRAAIGKEVSPADFTEYMAFHARRLFTEAYLPAPMCFAVRRSLRHSPEGTMSIESTALAGGGEAPILPIMTMASRSVLPESMYFPINASTRIAFNGEAYLHGYLQHNFSGGSAQKLNLVMRAKQFSSMLVLVGRITSATEFSPSYAAIVQNKDELTIPLELSTIPTAQEFKDAIESLSPEQQAFAKAFRAMQLESTLFGILVVQIKPQLESVLNLPEDSLTKEIKLTQELMQMFTKYQIPTDLLAFDPASDAGSLSESSSTPAQALAAVRKHVSAIRAMITESQQEEIQQRLNEVRYEQPIVHHRLEEREEEGRRIQATSDMLESLEARSSELNSFSSAMSSGLKRAKKKCSAPMMMECAAAPAQAQRRRLSGAEHSTTSATKSAGSPQQAQPQQPREPQQKAARTGESRSGVGEGAVSILRDYTKVPQQLDNIFEKIDPRSCVRPTIINVGEPWSKRSQAALLAQPTTQTLNKDKQKEEKDAAYDLLDALTKSGALPLQHAALHVVIASTHCFDKTVTETVVQDNANPIEMVERTVITMATTVHQQPLSQLVLENQRERLEASLPALADLPSDRDAPTAQQPAPLTM
eukprot:TRINITY_DN3711_c0_g1_i2.p1 TRINITY_DN3711_c0_g1~~TRINITY_DN3711_c0_g1_i2.p1  ORF type:complete len:979 (-),score=227.99 TRINITY_DN3711_c0_g1_i2:315-3251(-)